MVCLVSLPSLSMQIDALLSNIIRGAFLGPHLAAVAPSTKATCLGYVDYKFIGAYGGDEWAGHGGKERERDVGIRWESGSGRNGRGLGRPERKGRRHNRTKISMNGI